MHKLKVPVEAMDRSSGDLLPHHPPMLFIERLVERKGDEAIAEAVIPQSGICRSENGFYHEMLVELIAQTAAMANGFDLAQEGLSYNDGMLVGIDSFSYGKIPQAGETVRIHTHKTFSFGSVSVISGEITGENGDIYGVGTIKVWEEKEAE